jgi:hypothetical protein
MSLSRYACASAVVRKPATFLELSGAAGAVEYEEGRKERWQMGSSRWYCWRVTNWWWLGCIMDSFCRLRVVSAAAEGVLAVKRGSREVLLRLILLIDRGGDEAADGRFVNKLANHILVRTTTIANC